MSENQTAGTAGVLSFGVQGVRTWQGWVPAAAVIWSLLYAAFGTYLAISAGGFDTLPEIVTGEMGPTISQFEPRIAWMILLLAGIPGAAVGGVMLLGARGRLLRPLLLVSGLLLAGVFLFLMTGLNLLIRFGYIPFGVYSLLTGAKFGRDFLLSLTQWAIIHQWLCMMGGFLWLAATVCYFRRSGDACLYCGRRDGLEGWRGPANAARWGRVAVYVAMLAPTAYAFTRLAWALGIALGMSSEHLRRGQASGTWISGLFLASFGLCGAFLMFGLVQRWGEVFPSWMIGLTGRRVPLSLAIIPASLVSVLLMVGGLAIWLRLPKMALNLAATGIEGLAIVWEIFIVIGPTLLFPLWGAALTVATLCYYYRRRNPCRVCSRGIRSETV